MIMQPKEISYTDLKKEYWNKAKRIERENIARKIAKALNDNKKKELHYNNKH